MFLDLKHLLYKVSWTWFNLRLLHFSLSCLSLSVLPSRFPPKPFLPGKRSARLLERKNRSSKERRLSHLSLSLTGQRSLPLSIPRALSLCLTLSVCYTTRMCHPHALSFLTEGRR